jgi:hypothetical protein
MPNNSEVRSARHQVLRDRLAALGGGPGFAPSPKPAGVFRAKHPNEKRPRRGKPAPRPVGTKVYMPWPEIIPDTKRAPRWMKEVEQKETNPLEAELPSGVKVMTAMAEKWLDEMKKPAISACARTQRI